MTTTRITKSPWPYRSTTPGASASFDIDGLQDLLRKQDEHLTWVQPDAPDTPQVGDRWADTTGGAFKVYFGSAWSVVGPFVAFVKAGTPVDGDFPSPPPDGTLAVDSVNERLYIKINGLWKYIVLA